MRRRMFPPIDRVDVRHFLGGVVLFFLMLFVTEGVFASEAENMECAKDLRRGAHGILKEMVQEDGYGRVQDRFIMAQVNLENARTSEDAEEYARRLQKSVVRLVRYASVTSSFRGMLQIIHHGVPESGQHLRE